MNSNSPTWALYLFVLLTVITGVMAFVGLVVRRRSKKVPAAARHRGSHVWG